MSLTSITWKKRLKRAAAMAALAAVFAVPALAQTPDLGLGFATATGLSTTDVRTVVGNVINVFLGLLGIVAVVLILYAGFLIMTAAGEEEKVSQGKRILSQAVIGLVIIMSSYGIARFVLRAIGAGGGALGESFAGEGCPPGQTCDSDLTGGGGGGLRLTGVTPVGPGPGDQGWPKEWSLTVGFNYGLASASVTDASVVVKKCSSRPHTLAEAVANCATGAPAVRVAEGSRVDVRPMPTTEGQPGAWEQNTWYFIQLIGGSITDVSGKRSLRCPFQTAELDISSASTPSNSCERAVFFGDRSDTAAPNVVINMPTDGTSVCAASDATLVATEVEAADDFLATRVDLRVDGGSTGLVDGAGADLAAPVSVVNGANQTPVFRTAMARLKPSALSTGSHVFAAKAYDGGQRNAEDSAAFIVRAPACCNGIKDGNETGVDVGGACGGGANATCTTNADCSAGLTCSQGHCVALPIIESVTPTAGGPGTLVTISGKNFGSPGRVVFLGGVGADDDKEARACAPSAWREVTPGNFEAVVAVPTGAADGPIKLETGGGASDATDVPPGSAAVFDVTAVALPGICTLEPLQGPAGTTVAVRGNGFGAERGTSTASVGSSNADIALGGWTNAEVRIVAPSLREGEYPVKLSIVNGANIQDTNTVDFTIRSSEDQPRITEINPTQGGVGTFVTIQGVGFGSSPGTVRFKRGTDVAVAEMPACGNTWTNNYIVVKVPVVANVTPTADGVPLVIEVSRVNPPRTAANGDFKVTTAAARPGICSISPDNGPPGTEVTVRGEGFGPASADAPSSATHLFPRNAVEFFLSAAKHCLASEQTTAVACDKVLGNRCDGTWSSTICVPNTKTAVNYDATAPWSATMIKTVVPGTRADKTTWPKTGPAYVIANNELSSNSIPFKVQDCKEGGSCAAGTICCADGTCKAASLCGPATRKSAYSWKFSTELLPALPVVVERSSCDPAAGILQSPSPLNGNTDACTNAKLGVEFNREMNASSLNAATVVVQDCGDGAAPADCAAPAGLTFAYNLDTATRKLLEVVPSNTLAANHWYKVTLNATGTSGVKDAAGKYLDGNRDGDEGDNYVFSFRVRNSTDACALSNVTVAPAAYTVTEQTTPLPAAPGLRATLLGANCNALNCRVNGVAKYALAWSAPTQNYLSLVPPLAGDCEEDVQMSAQQETPPAGPPVTLTVEATPIVTPPQIPLSKSGSAAISVKFADPRVVAYAPNCSEACVNGVVSATFNVFMDESSFVYGQSVKVDRCRDAACNPPYLAAPDNIGVDFEDEDAATPPHAKKVVVSSAANAFSPDSWYLVTLSPRTVSASGIESASGVPLTGLNTGITSNTPDGTSFTWKFKTRASGQPCTPSRADLAPAESTLLYVGARQDLRARPWTAPDSCSASGQQLVPDSTQSWNWAINNPAGFTVLSGFIDGIGASAQAHTLHTPAPGCTAQCTLAGSRNDLPQCGNGIVERGEDCEAVRFTVAGNVATPVFADGCSSTSCRYIGVAASACGDGNQVEGEACDKVGGVFPPGCKDPVSATPVGRPDLPDLTGKGCIWLGSAGNSVCGDARITDGEGCDDGNAGAGDGCSGRCLNEGSLPSCLDVASPNVGVNCTNFCGNGRLETGEGCEGVMNAVGQLAFPSWCDRRTCLPLGTDACSTATGSGCCGNNHVDNGEECDGPFGQKIPGCSQSCLLIGSTYLGQPNPSFCGDRNLGPGEAAQCDGPSVAASTPIDPYQVVVAGNASSTDPAKSTSTVSATLSSIPAGKEGRATVSLSCTCKNPGVAANFCSTVDPAHPELGCNRDGCCEAGPIVSSIAPPDGYSNPTAVCRNSSVTIVFDQPMDEVSVKQNVLVGEQCGGTPAGGTVRVCRLNPMQSCAIDANCTGAGNTCETRTLLASVGNEASSESFWRRALRNISSFIRSLFVADVSAVTSAPQSPPPGARFCLVEGDFLTNANQTVFSPKNAFNPNRWHRVSVAAGTLSQRGVALAAPRTGDFKTRGTICRIDRVVLGMYPESQLLMNRQEQRSIWARALEAGGTPVISTPAYAFDWSWNLLPSPDPAIAYEKGGNTPNTCSAETTSANCFGHGGCIWTGTPAACRTSSSINVRVRGSQPSLDNNVPTKDGEAVVKATTTVTAGLGQDESVEHSGTRDLTVMMCDNPWPAVKLCSAADTSVYPWWSYGRITTDGNPQHLPEWDNNLVRCTPNSRVWVPFYDRETNLKFYYCRDTQSGGGANDLLPALNERPVVIRPGGNIFKEFLFSFPGKDDAIGLRIEGNSQHLRIGDWFSSKGFAGAGAPTKLGGYDALRSGNTVYVNAVNIPWECSGNPSLKCVDTLRHDISCNGNTYTNGLCRPGSSAYPNIYSFSYVGSAPETPVIFNRLVAHTDLNIGFSDQNVCLNEYGYAYYVDGKLVSCIADQDCQKEAFARLGSAAAYRAAKYTCDSAQTSLIRDVKRWGDLMSLRRELVVRGSVPTLQAGTFLRATVSSAWPSWAGTFGQELGTIPPQDPVNAHGICLPPYDSATCWNGTAPASYQCPQNSNVYVYRSFGPSQFSLQADLETRCGRLNYAACTGSSLGMGSCRLTNTACIPEIGGRWRGGTCLEHTYTAKTVQQDCLDKAECQWDTLAAKCQYRVGRIDLGGTLPTANACNGTSIGANGVCGDGVVQSAATPSEVCEPGQTQTIACHVSVSGVTRTGSVLQRCKQDCSGWEPVAPWSADQCQVGRCGDGVIQLPETCDDGDALNGTYGHCSAPINGVGGCGMGFSCGDGQRQPSEACDCGANNGSYRFNGVLATSSSCTASGASAPSCAWDCSGAGPRCGDGIKNQNEQCDGDIQEFKGFCSDAAQTGCNVNADCPSGSACGHFCATPEQKQHRVCNSNDVDNSPADDDSTACTWAQWECTAPGQCGDGAVQTGEQCDDGNSNNSDSCVIDPTQGAAFMCRDSRCGDGFVDNSPDSTERCDNGDANNGVPCIPTYSHSCNYCTRECSVGTVSGGFCGNNIVEDQAATPPGPEQCDGGLQVGSFVCMSTKPAEQSCGLKNGVTRCNSEQCVRECNQPDTELCFNDVQSGNSDVTPVCNPGQQTCPTITTVAACSYVQGDVETAAAPLYDSCDPDQDNDGVPNALDCEPKNSSVHPAFNRGNISIARPLDCVEISGAQVDNDCSGPVSNDNLEVKVRARGTISDACGDLRPMFSIKYHKTDESPETFHDAIAQRLGYSWNTYTFNVCGVNIDKIRVALTTNDGLTAAQRGCNYDDVTAPGQKEWDPDILVDSVTFGGDQEIKIAKLQDEGGTGTCRFPPTKERVKLFGKDNLGNDNPYNTSGIVPTDGKTCSQRTNSNDCRIYNTCRWVSNACETAKLCLNSPQVTGQPGTGSGGGSESSFIGEDCNGTPSSGAIRCNGYFEVRRNP